MCDTDSISPSFCSTRVRAARKPHRCDACGEAIGPGQRYRSINGKWDGDVLVVKQCSRCARLYDELVWEGDAETIALALDCGEHIEDPEHPLQWLAFALPGDPELESR
jgi:hypothetical protein